GLGDRSGGDPVGELRGRAVDLETGSDDRVRPQAAPRHGAGHGESERTPPSDPTPAHWGSLGSSPSRGVSGSGDAVREPPATRGTVSRNRDPSPGSPQA